MHTSGAQFPILVMYYQVYRLFNLLKDARANMIVRACARLYVTCQGQTIKWVAAYAR